MDHKTEVTISIVGVLIGAVSLILFLRRGSGSAAAAPTVVQVPSQTADTSGGGITAAPLDLSSGGDLSGLLSALLGNSGSGAGTGTGSGAATVVQPPSGYNYGVSADSPPPSSQLTPVTNNQDPTTATPAQSSPGLSKFAYSTAVATLTGEPVSQAAGVPGPNPAGVPASYASPATDGSGSPASVSAAGPGGAVHPVVYTTSDPRPGGVSPARGTASTSGVPPTYNPQVPTQSYDSGPAVAPPSGISGGQAPAGGTAGTGTAQAGGAGGQVTAPRAPASVPATTAPSGLAGGTAPSSGASGAGTATASAPPRTTAGRIVQGLVGTGAAA